jgi:dTDP-4-dehydrorhamnose 3,5-epimerase-like enzyme
MRSCEISFNQKGDNRGQLVVLESGKEVPFNIQRVFYIYGSDADVVRGKHANIKSEFVLVNVQGKSKVKVNDGKHSTIYELNEPHRGIYIPKMLWKEMYDFSSDSVLLVFASEHYDDAEYIRDYDVYQQMMRTHQ